MYGYDYDWFRRYDQPYTWRPRGPDPWQEDRGYSRAPAYGQLGFGRGSRWGSPSESYRRPTRDWVEQGGLARGWSPRGGYAEAPHLGRSGVPYGWRQGGGYDTARSPREEQSHQQRGPIRDDDVRRAVTRNLQSDDWLDPESIDVEVEDGIVTLSGEVDEHIQVRYAWDDAWEAEGVRGVMMRLEVKE